MKLMMLACPFCGGDPEINRKGNASTTKRSVKIRCVRCGAERTESALKYSMKWLENVAITKWNQRSTNELPEDVRSLIYRVTLHLQSIREKTPKQSDLLFQDAYRIYAKYGVEK